MNNRRLTSHNKRGGKNGAFSPKHNDRNFDLSESPHINPERIRDNFYIHCYSRESPDMTFEEAECMFYKEHFTKALEAQNERYRTSGHEERCKTMDDYRTNLRTCPEETLYYVGNKDNDVDIKVFKAIMSDFNVWRAAQFPNVKNLDMAFHVDEEGQIHCHGRQVWVALDKDGNECVSQTKALEAMGIERPDPSKPKSRHNNPKQTYTAMCREKLFEICREHGYEITEEPREASRSGKTMLEYQIAELKKKRDQEALRYMDLRNANIQAVDNLDCNKGRYERMEQLMKDAKFKDGHSLYDDFEAQETARMRSKTHHRHYEDYDR